MTDPVSPARPKAKARTRKSPEVLRLASPPVQSPVRWQTSRQVLDRARLYWEQGDWHRLLGLEPADVEDPLDRAWLALLVAAAESHAGDIGTAQRHGQQALQWGCHRDLAARVLASAVHNSLARVALALEDESEANAHFEAAIGVVQPHTDIVALARIRRLREAAQMGLLPEAARFISEEIGLARTGQTDSTARLTVLGSEIATLQHELMLSLKRGQLYAGAADRPGAAAPGPADMAALRAQSVAQLGQDLWVIEQSGFKRGGYFVEFGATDGVLLSNTWLLETAFGWTGLCAEPNPAYFSKLQQNRRCTLSNACIGARSGEEVEFILANEYGGIAAFAEADTHAERRAAYRAEGQVIRVTTVSLDDALRQADAPHDIDYLSIDTEGSELDILTAFPFDRWNIRLITVEHNNSPQRDALRTLLERAGYRWTHKHIEDWYERIA